MMERRRGIFWIGFGKASGWIRLGDKVRTVGEEGERDGAGRENREGRRGARSQTQGESRVSRRERERRGNHGRSARATIREGSMSPPRDPSGPQGISMHDDEVEGVFPPPPPLIHLGQGDPTSLRPRPPTPHLCDGRTTRAHSPFTRPQRQRPRKAADMT